MADPTKYIPDFSFSGYQASNPTKPMPGPRLDDEFANISASIGETVDGLEDIRRADGKLQNGIVTTDSLSSDIVFAEKPPEQWTPGVQYVPPQIVAYGNNLYRCLIAHTASVFSTDLAAGKWEEVIRLQQAIDAADYAQASALAAAASAEDAEAAAAAIGLPGTAVALNYLRQKNDLSGFEYRTPAQVRSDIGAIAELFGTPIGAMVKWPTLTPPTGWLIRNGQAISRTTYAALFSVIGTTYGAGDGSTTFNVMDDRGEFERNLDLGRGVDVDRVLGTAQDSQNLAHSHAGTASSAGAHSHTVARGGTGGGAFVQSGLAATSGTVSTSSNGAHTHAVTTVSSGGTEARPRNKAYVPIIFAGA